MIRNAAREPEIIEVQNFINCMGGEIRGAGTDTIRIAGTNGPLRGVDYTVIPDRIEAGTLAVCAAVSGGDITMRPVIIEHMELVAAKLAEAGRTDRGARRDRTDRAGTAAPAAANPFPALSRISH